VNRALLLILLVPLAGCFESHFGSCTETRACIRVDAIGCCTVARPTLVAVCDACPDGTVEVDACRSGGCEVVCDEPMQCREDLGAGCCGDEVPGGCEACPAGSVTVGSCESEFPECGCDEMRRFPVPGDTLCFSQITEACCDSGDAVPALMCGCPDGYLAESSCTFDGDIIETECYRDLGNGCCGEAELSLCGVCPAGTLLDCAAVIEAGKDRAGGAPQEPPRECLIEMDDGVCGCPIDFDACGQCPAGSTQDCSFIECDSP
jgi:hypothetical protein